MFSYVLALFISSSVVDVMLPIMPKVSAIVKSEFGRTLKFLLLLEKKDRLDNDSGIKEHHLFSNHSDFDDFPILVANSSGFEFTLMETFNQ